MSSKQQRTNGPGLTLSENFLICPICNNDFNAPKMLPCLHSFCYECLEKSLSESNIGSGQSFLCPLCMTQCTVPERGVRAMKTNILFVTLQEFYYSKTLSPDQICDGCESERLARKKCIECNDWLCNQCCTMHLKVKITKDHHLISPEELGSGRYDGFIKDSFEPVVCSKHNEPLRLYCTESSCQVPICTVCKTTLGHDGHDAIELADQAVRESQEIRALLPNTQRFIDNYGARIGNMQHEEKITKHVRKKMHKAINDRMQQVIDDLVKKISAYSDSLHEKVDTMAKEHEAAIAKEVQASKMNVTAAESAKVFTETLLGFNKSEELVSLSREVKARLSLFQKQSEEAPPSWRQPRMNPSEELDSDMLAKIFGTLTFQGEVVKSVLIKTFQARIPSDEKDCALCDISLDPDGAIIVVDRDNRKIKKFDLNGNLIMSSGDSTFKAPNRVAVLKNTRNIVVKDDKYLKVLDPNGRMLGYFGDQLKQPVGLTQTTEGEVLITEWMGGVVVGFDERGKKTRSFPCSCEAPGYITSSPNGNIVLSDWKQNTVKVFDSSGKFLRQYGEYGNGKDQLDHPYGLCADKFNNIIITDTWNNRIHLLTDEGKRVSTLLSKDDGIAWPQAVTVDKYGHLIVVEQQGLIKIYQYVA